MKRPPEQSEGRFSNVDTLKSLVHSSDYRWEKLIDERSNFF